MKEEDRAEFGAMVLGMAEIFDKNMTTSAIELYWQVLKHLELEEVSRLISAAVSDPDRGRFIPKPGDILSFVVKPSAVVAWNEVLDAMEQYGAYRSVRFQDQVTNAIIRDLGGWPEVCHRQVTDENEWWLQKEFERRYGEYRKTGRRYAEPLIGLADADNRNKTLPEWVGEPTLIQSGQALPMIEAHDRKLLQ